MKRPKFLSIYSHSEPIYETDATGKRYRTGSRHVAGNGRQLGEPTYYQKAVLAALLVVASVALGGCYVQNRSPAPDTAHHPTGGKLPADLAVDGQFGGPTFTGEARPASGAQKAY